MQRFQILRSNELVKYFSFFSILIIYRKFEFNFKKFEKYQKVWFSSPKCESNGKLLNYIDSKNKITGLLIGFN